MNDTKPIAHIAEDGRGHLLEEHLRGTVELAAKFDGNSGARGNS